MYRIKTIYGGKLKSRSIENQKTESMIVLNYINIMTGLGTPESCCHFMILKEKMAKHAQIAEPFNKA